MEKGYLNSFPSDKNEALAMLYLKNQDLSAKTPEEINTLYWDAYLRICQDEISKQRNGNFNNEKNNILQQF